MLEDLVTPPERRATYLDQGWWDGSTLPSVVAAHAQQRPDAVAVTDENGRLTYAELWADARRVAGWLRGRGVGEGDVVSVQLPNRADTVVLALGVLASGAVINPLLPNYRLRELQHVFSTALPKVIFTPSSYRGFEYAPLVTEATAAAGVSVAHVTVGGRVADLASLADLLGNPSHDPDAAELPDRDAAAVSELIFTSGTEATPKAIMHTERTTNGAVRIARDDLALGPDTVVWMPSPVGHSTGFNYGLRLALLLGVPLVLQDVWDPARAVDLVEAHGCTYTLAATTFLADLVAECQRRGVRLDSLDCFGCGGAPVPAPLVRAAAEVGITVLRLYGSTEVLVATWNRAASSAAQRENTDGRAMTACELEVRTDDGAPAGPGEPGEIFVRSPAASIGFFADPERTAATFSPDGWVRSGDLATLDADGHLTIVGRRKEIIIRGGMNITPREIEDLIAELDAVERVAVVGVPDERLGERTCACIVPRGDATVDLDTVVAHLRGRGLATYKLPQQLEVFAQLPTTASGKIQKHEILRQLEERTT
ncbi:MAG: AMP-binding protein [Acidimicrobiales bacterium]|nr:AMP-binding protein [Acidimicrobiales bacterium]